MQASGWGNYPRIEAQWLEPASERALMEQLDRLAAVGSGVGAIARGLGRSYGDSALAPQLISTRYLDRVLEFDADTGLLRCGAGVSLDQLIALLLPRGWFPVVVPGTRYVTVGGAVASDIHGKNHHRDGSFSRHVLGMRVATAGHGIIECSPTQHAELFHATCGGMGLTGVILDVTLRLRRVDSAFIDSTSWRAANLDEALELMRQQASAHYSVAWIDCAGTGRHLGRAVLTTGEHSGEGELSPPARSRWSIPFELPAQLLNRHSIRLFNGAYYHAADRSGVCKRVHLGPYFFPLDGIRHWNRLYGSHGFLQYQAVLPYANGEAGLRRILAKVGESGRGSPLAVLKAMGEGNGNPLSFPRAGYTLALDFKRERSLDVFLNQLDQIVLDHGGRIYLSKDARMSGAVFKRSYPRWESFVATRREYGADRLFNSLQSTRLGL